MKKINFDPQLFINQFNSKIKFVNINVPKDSLNQIIKIAKNKFSNKNNKEVTFSLDCFKYKGVVYKQLCRIIPNTGELGYEIIDGKSDKSIFSFLYVGEALPDYISTIIDVRDYLFKEMGLKDSVALKKSLSDAYSKGFSHLSISNKQVFFYYENELLTCKYNGKIKSTFYIPDQIFDIGITPTLHKYLNLSIDEFDSELKTLTDMETFNIEFLNEFIKYINSNLGISRKEFLHISSKLLNYSCYKYKDYLFSLDGLLLPAIIIQATAPDSKTRLTRFILNDDALEDLYTGICDFNETDLAGIDAFQLAKELIEILNLPSDKIFQIFSEITLATVENEIDLIDNYKLYIYVKEGKALLYNGNSLVEKFSINKKAFNGIRIDYYHYLSNF